uniref:Flagellin n=1 Tax=Arcobacter nitrofigilis TaxID=28199 RepID=A8BSM2_9BACT|nr:flagellin A [Arcobacter nitrofigilis DSM 7299]
MRINTNIASLNAQEAAANTNKKIATSLERLSTGLKVNKASDDASGLAIADKLRTQASSISQGIDNGNSAVALIQIADKSMSEQSNILDTVKAKLIQANTDTTSPDGREAIRKDIVKLLEQLDNIAQQTSYNGITLLQDSYDSMSSSIELKFQIGGNKDDIMKSSFIQSNTVGLGGGQGALDQVSGSSTRNNVISQGLSTVISGDGTNPITLDGYATGTAIKVNITGIPGDITANGPTELSKVDSTTQLVLEALANATSGVNGSPATVEVKDINDRVIGTFTLETPPGTSIASGLVMHSTPGLNGAEPIVTFSLASGATIGMGGKTINTVEIAGDPLNTFTIGAMTISQTSASGNITFDANAQNLNIQNLNSANGQELKVTTATGSITGGGTLAGLKALQAGQLTQKQAVKYQGIVDAALSQMNIYRSDLGSTQNQVESAVRNLMTQKTNVTAAESVIRDVDYAQEFANFNKQNIIAQAGNYAMSQANSVAQNVLRLLQ